jgi:hypothetical protein
MKKLIMTGLVVLGGLVAVGRAATTEGAAARSAEWMKGVETAVNDATKVAAIMQALPEARRGEFASEVLAQVQAKKALMPNQEAWQKAFREEALALLAGAGKGAQEDVMEAVANALLRAYQPASGEWTESAVDSLASLTGGVLAALGGDEQKLLLVRIRNVVGTEKKMAAAFKAPMFIAWDQLIDFLRAIYRYQNQGGIGLPPGWFSTAGGQYSWHGGRGLH